jgi:hypothetical protein
MKHVWGILGCGLFLFLTIYQATMHGRKWEFGTYGMPVSLLAEDGRHYRDGSEVDPLTLALVRSGNEETVHLIIVGVLLLMLGWLMLECRKLHRLMVRRAILDLVQEKRLKGKWEEAAAGLRYYEKLTGRRQDKQNP